MTWEAVPEGSSELNDYIESLWMVLAVKSFPDAVATIDFWSGNYKTEVTDEDNPLLEDAVDEDAGNEEVAPGPEEESDDEVAAMHSSVSSTLVTVCAFKCNCFLIKVSMSTSVPVVTSVVGKTKLTGWRGALQILVRPHVPRYE